MADKTLLDDRKIMFIKPRINGWEIELSCGHKFWSPTEISLNLLITCYQCVRKYAFEEKNDNA